MQKHNLIFIAYTHYTFYSNESDCNFQKKTQKLILGTNKCYTDAKLNSHWKCSPTSRPASAHIEHILHSMHCHFNCLTAAASSAENFRQLGWPAYQNIYLLNFHKLNNNKAAYIRINNCLELPTYCLVLTTTEFMIQKQYSVCPFSTLTLLIWWEKGI